MTWRSLGDSNPCFRRERASFSYLIVLAALGNKKLGPDWLEKAGVENQNM